MLEPWWAARKWDRTALDAGRRRGLGEDALRWARQQGHAGMQLNAVVQTNRAAVHLGQSLGFAVMTTIPGAFAHPTLGRVGLHVTHRALSAERADQLSDTAKR